VSFATRSSVTGLGGVFLLFEINFNAFFKPNIRLAQYVLYRFGSCRRNPCAFLASETSLSTGKEIDIPQWRGRMGSQDDLQSPFESSQIGNLSARHSKWESQIHYLVLSVHVRLLPLCHILISTSLGKSLDIPSDIHRSKIRRLLSLLCEGLLLLPFRIK
jgi:hypothetical protein